MVKKLKYLLFIIPLLFIDNVKAQTHTLSFNRFRTTAVDMTSSISCNSSSCNVTNVPFGNYTTTFEWTVNNAPSCSGDTLISGSLATDNPSFGIINSDYAYNRVYLTTNGFDYPCAFSVNSNGTSFSCSSSNLGTTFSISYVLDNNFGGDVHLNSVISRSFNINCDNSTQEIIDNNNFNTDRIINNDINTSNAIINNQNQNSQNIINNQNQNTQQQIESQKACFTKHYRTSDFNNYGYIDQDGNITSNTQNWKYSDYIEFDIEKDKLYVDTYYDNAVASTCFYNVNKSKISCKTLSILYVGEITVPSNTKYIRFTGRISNDLPLYAIKTCDNGNQVLNDSVNNLNDTLNDTSQPNTNQDISDMEDMVASDTPISDLITMPLTLINAYINGVNSTCSPVNLGNLYGSDLILPCINLEQRFGSNLWGIIDAFFSLFMCYNIGMLFVSAFDGLTSLRDDFEGLYQPRHADTGYQPRHGG